MITMMFVLGTVVRRHKLVPAAALRPACMGAAGAASPQPQPWQAECYYEAYVRTRVFEPLGMASSGFLPPPARAAAAAPACVDTGFRACPVRGVVSDLISLGCGERPCSLGVS